VPPLTHCSRCEKRRLRSLRMMASTQHAEDSDDEPEVLQYKVILLGDGATGKTSIAARFTDDVFAQQYKQTIGLDFFMKRLSLPGGINAAL